jgi:hypothetical protein
VNEINRRSFLVGAAGVVGVITCAAAPSGKGKPSPKPTPTPTATPTPVPTPSGIPSTVRFGTLASDPARAGQEFTAGLRLAGHETYWDRLESSDGVFGSFDGVKADHDAFLNAGLALQLEPGIHYAPSYVKGLPNGRFVNQFGQVGGPPNMTWSPDVRGRVERFVTKLAAAVDLSTYAAIRIGGGGTVETLYPAHNAGGTANGYWAFDALAQAACPFPGLKPGDTSTHWAEWYGWYLDALVDEVLWKIDLYRSLGFGGRFHVLMPGSGARPSTVSSAIANRMTIYGDVMARGAAWHEIARRLTPVGFVDAYCSSAAEGAVADYTQPGDQSLTVADPALNSWSSMRWLAFLAGQYGLGASGENPGYPAGSYGRAMMHALVTQAKVAGWTAAMWAHDRNLYDGTGPTLADYSTEIS